jgi:hypothetical protein
MAMAKSVIILHVGEVRIHSIVLLAISIILDTLFATEQRGYGYDMGGCPRTFMERALIVILLVALQSLERTVSAIMTNVIATCKVLH